MTTVAKGRYSQLIDAVDLFKPKTIVEVGTWNGLNAIRMIQRAEKYHEKVIYIGYDLFEEANEKTDTEEFNVKAHHTEASVYAEISKNCPKAEIQLIKGNTRKTLKAVSADLCFIDGGHSIETIANDFDKCKGSTIIIMDDYYSPDESGKTPDVTKYGCNNVITNSAGVVLPIADKVEGGGLNQMVLIVGGQ